MYNEFHHVCLDLVYILNVLFFFFFKVQHKFRFQSFLALAQVASSSSGGFFSGIFGGSSSSSAAASSGSAVVAVTQAPVSSLCPSRRNPVACAWCNTNGRDQATCTANANGLNNTDDPVNSATDATGDDCLWYSDTNICLNDEGANTTG